MLDASCHFYVPDRRCSVECSVCNFPSCPTSDRAPGWAFLGQRIGKLASIPAGDERPVLGIGQKVLHVKLPYMAHITKPAVLTPLWKWEVPRLQQGLPGTASLPHRLRPQGGPAGGGSSVVVIRSLPTQQLPPGRSTSAMRWVTLVTFSIVAWLPLWPCKGHIFCTSQDRHEVNLELVTVAGTEYTMQANLSHCEDVAELEDDILCFLPAVSDLEVFGCELELLDLRKQQPLSEAFRTVLLQLPGRRQRKLPQSSSCPGQPASAHRGSPGGREPPLSKGVSPYCRTWKDHAKHCPCLVNTCFWESQEGCP